MINIYHTYSDNVDVTYYSDEIQLCCKDTGEMDTIAEQVSEILVKHNFSYAHVTSASTGELLMIIERE